MPELHSGVKLGSNEVNIVEDAVVSNVAAHSNTSLQTHLTKTSRQPVNGDWYKCTVFGLMTGTADTKTIEFKVTDGSASSAPTLTWASAAAGSYRATFWVVINDTNGEVYFTYDGKYAAVASTVVSAEATVTFTGALTITLKTKVTNAGDSISVASAIIEHGGHWT